APAPPPPVVDGPAAERRREIMDLFDGMKQRTHFEMLGLTRSATDAQVKDAYFRMAKRFHPDVHHDASLGDLRDKLEAVFIRLGQAYETLKNPKTRTSYEERLGSGAFGVAAAAQPPEPPPPPPDPAEELRKAELAIRTAEKLYEKEKFWDAIQILEPAVPIVTGKMKQRGRVTLARCYLKNPNWAKRAEAELLEAAREDPKNVDAHFILGTIYKERGLNARALSMFRKVVELKPDHEEVHALLAAVAPPEAPSEERGGGLISRLFKKP
ncbi:MAG: DnaJ domain-containing protein, partial [Solirubrobacterales bacterium]